jgi:hypothetical protein
VAELLWFEDLTDVHLVLHSYAGILAGPVAERALLETLARRARWQGCGGRRTAGQSLVTPGLVLEIIIVDSYPGVSGGFLSTIVSAAPSGNGCWGLRGEGFPARRWGFTALGQDHREVAAYGATALVGVLSPVTGWSSRSSSWPPAAAGTAGACLSAAGSWTLLRR